MGKEAFSIFDVFRERGIIREAGEDDDNAPAEEAPADDNAEEGDAAPADDNAGGDDDFDIDASLDDDEDNQDDNGEEGGESGDDMSSDTSSSDDSGDEEVNKDNTDIFAALTAEEQQIKIKELKNLYQSMYSSCDEVLNRINNLKTNEDNLQIISRLSYSMYDLKKYISDYLTLIFPQKSYVENDIAFNRFLMIIKSITTILDKYQKKVERGTNKDN